MINLLRGWVHARLALGIIAIVWMPQHTLAQVTIADDQSEALNDQKADPPRKYAFAIPAQSLITALDSYNLQTGGLLFYDSRLVSGLRSSAVSGVLDADVALDTLLTGTNLAPLKTESGVISLMMRRQDITFATASPVSAPVLTLNVMKVSALPGGDHHYYATALAYAIQGALQRDGYLRRINYRLNMNVWVSSSGGIADFQFIEPIDDKVMNRTISGIMHRLTVDQAPPDLDQPVHIKIHASGAS